MQDRLREIEGTLARTKERKNTILYKLSKRKKEEERLARIGVEKLPTNPHDVEDVSVVKYALFRLKQEIGDKAAHLRDSKLHSVDKDGEAVIRAKNDEINKLVSRRNQWEARLAKLSGSPLPVAKRRKLFFGCAKDLPEAEAVRKRPRDAAEGSPENQQEDESSDEEEEREEEEPLLVQNEEDDVASQDAHYLERVSWLGSTLADDDLLREEREAEAKLREKTTTSSNAASYPSFVRSYCVNGTVTIPSEAQFKELLISKRKEALQERLKALRKS